MKNIFNKAINFISRTFVENLPFFVIFSILLLPHVFSGFMNDARMGFSVIKFPISLNVLVFNTSEVLAIAFLCCVLLSITKSTFFKILLYVFVLSVFGINIYLRICFGTLFTSSIMSLMAETNSGEASEFIENFFFQPKSLIVLAGLLLLGLLTVAIEKWYHKKKVMLNSIILRTTLSLFIVFVLTLSIKETVTYIDSFRNQTFSSFDNIMHDMKFTRIDYCRRMLSEAFFLHLSGKEKQQAVNMSKSCLTENFNRPAHDSLNIIVVIGESFIKSHAPFYGYTVNTMPFINRLVRTDSMFVFSNVVTTSKFTSNALRNFFSCNSVGDGERWCEAPFFPTVFKAAGYDVFYWDNQYNKSTKTDAEFGLNAYVHDPALSKCTFNGENDRNYQYDGELIYDLQHSSFPSLYNEVHNTLIILHLMGQHFVTKKRYPATKEYLRFTADSIKRNEPFLTANKKEEIASYDNAVFYNDYVLAKVIEMFNEKNAVMIFFSDHGELVYDVSDVVGRAKNIENMTPVEIPYYYEIPMIVWLSDRYRHKYMEMANLLKDNKDKPLMSDNICQMLFHIANISSKWYSSKLDVLSPHYQCPPRIIENYIDYDKFKMKK